MLDVKRLRLLVELDRRGTISAVAQALSYSPSAVSQQLSVLEREAGARLLEPIGRRVRLTSQGELLVGHARLVLAELERAETALAASRRKVTGTVRMAAFQSAVLALLPAALIHLRRHATLRVEVTEMEPEQSLPALIAGDFDLVLGEEYPGYPGPRLPGVDWENLMTDELQLVLPATWGSITLPDLAGRPFALEPNGTTSREWALTVCRNASFDPDIRYTSTDLQIHLRMVENGLAAALLPALAVPRDRPGVAVLPLPGRPVRQIFTATRDGGRGRPAIRAVVEELRGDSEKTVQR